jgi:hypothetical protein
VEQKVAVDGAQLADQGGGFVGNKNAINHRTLLPG